MHVTSIGNLRPCEHQVAGHLFEEGKAGSLVDDRGHFYKPIQVGPRGDREREFYEAVAAALAEEELQREELQAWAAAAAAQQQPLQNGWVGGAAAAGSAPRSSPKQIFAARPSLANVRVPSFRERDVSHSAVQIAQRDEFGLLGTPTLRDLRVGSSGDDWLGRSPDSEGAELTADHLMDGFSLQHSDGRSTGSAGHASSAAQQQQQQQQTGRHQAQQQHMGQQQSQQQSRQQQRARHVRKALSDPRHAEAAALLGQPVYDVELRQAGQAAHRAHHHYHHHYEPQPQTQPQAFRRSSPPREDSKGQGQLAAGPPSSPFQQGRGFVVGGDADAAMHAADGGKVSYEGAPLQQQQEQRGPVAAAGQHPAVGGQAPAAEPGSSGSGMSEQQQQQPAFSIPDRSFSAPAAAGSYDVHGLQLRGLEVPEASGELAAERVAGEGAGDSSMAGPSSALSPRGGPRTWLGDSTSDSEEEGDSAAVGGGGGKRAPRRSVFPRLPFSVRNALLLEAIPKFYGVVEAEGRTFLELEDLTRNYRRPSIIDIKVGFRTWYPSASQAYIERCRVKDGSTTQASLGFKICGMQVYRHGQGGYWRASKRWCKTLPAELVDKALLSFAHNEGGVRPEHVYGGPHGAIAQLQSLESWFELQREFHFYSSSVLILYEGGATAGEDARVRVRCVDFAHTFKLEEGRQQRDHNYLAGLRAIIARLAGVLRADTTDSLA